MFIPPTRIYPYELAEFDSVLTAENHAKCKEWENGTCVYIAEKLQCKKWNGRWEKVFGKFEYKWVKTITGGDYCEG